MEGVDTHGEHVGARVVGGDDRVRRTRSRRTSGRGLLLGVLALAGAAGLVALPTVPASAATTTTAAPSADAADQRGPGADTAVQRGPGADATPAPAPAPTALPDLQPSPTPTGNPQNEVTPGTGTPTGTPTGPSTRPTIADPGDVTTSTVRFHGTGTPGHRVLVTGPAATGSTGCGATVDAGGSWACFATVRSGPQQVFSVQDRTEPTLLVEDAPASDVVVPPVVTTSRPTTGPVSGTGLPGARVALTVPGTRADRTATVSADGRWTVSLADLADTAGRDRRATVTATQTATTAAGFRSDLRSAASTPVVVTVDRTPPTAPRITSPTPGTAPRAQPLTVSGSGEAGATLVLAADRAPVCRTTVAADGRWRCVTSEVRLAAGQHVLTALQQDAAGNASSSSAGVSLRIAAAGTSGAATDGATGGATSGSTSPSAGATSASGAGTGGTRGPTGSAPGGPSGDGASGAGVDGPGSAGGSGGLGGSGVRDWSGPAGDWTAATGYDHAVPTIQASFSWRTVLVATAVAAGFLVLVAAPLALAGAAARGRLRVPFAGLLGRNRSREERRRGEDPLPTWAAVAIGAAVVALSTVLGVGVSLEARYVRLAVAVLLGASVLAVTTVLAVRWAAGTDRRAIGFRVSPWLVVAALVAGALTRTFDLSPALVVGVVLVPVGRPGLGTGPLRLGSGLAAGARCATWRTVSLLVVATAGWVLHSLTLGGGFWTAAVSEFATTLCVGGLGALVVTLLPLAGSAGSALLAVSRGRYVAVASVAVALAAAVGSAPSGHHLPPVALAVVAAGCVGGAVASQAAAARRNRTVPPVGPGG